MPTPTFSPEVIEKLIEYRNRGLSAEAVYLAVEGFQKHINDMRQVAALLKGTPASAKPDTDRDVIVVLYTGEKLHGWAEARWWVYTTPECRLSDMRRIEADEIACWFEIEED